MVLTFSVNQRHDQAGNRRLGQFELVFFHSFPQKEIAIRVTDNLY